MLLKEIGRKIAQAFRLARAADEKVASIIAAALDAKAEQLREYEKSFEPEPPEPDPLLEAQRTEKRPEKSIRDVPAAGHHQIHERTSGRLECGQSNR